MPDPITQATWHDGPEVGAYLKTFTAEDFKEDIERGMRLAVSARDREVAATLRAKIEALQDGLRFGDVRREAVLAVLDAVLGGGDS